MGVAVSTLQTCCVIPPHLGGENGWSWEGGSEGPSPGWDQGGAAERETPGPWEGQEEEQEEEDVVSEWIPDSTTVTSEESPYPSES